ncbi:cytochrome c3 family protein [Alicyclobacillus ferrooxydans]|uniref:cytochrome c3 family protein n=1 Tax=Alicyclobacillus ferrooxydans TaxID=471514 RepID=UPI00146FF924
MPQPHPAFARGQDCARCHSYHQSTGPPHLSATVSGLSSLCHLPYHCLLHHCRLHHCLLRQRPTMYHAPIPKNTAYSGIIG